MPKLRPSHIVVLAIATIVIATTVVAVLIPALQRARGGAERMPVASALRIFVQAINAHQAEDHSPHSTVFVLLHQRMFEPETLFMTRPTRLPAPPMPTIEAFNYQGITARDAYAQSISREQIIAAADAVLGDDPWERIGSLWLIRRASTWSGPDYGSVILGFAFHELRSGHYVWIARPNALVLAYAQGDPDLPNILTTAIAAAEAASVAPPPQELIDFVHTPPEPRR